MAGKHGGWGGVGQKREKKRKKPLSMSRKEEVVLVKTTKSRAQTVFFLNDLTAKKKSLQQGVDRDNNRVEVGKREQTPRRPAH